MSTMKVRAGGAWVATGRAGAVRVAGAWVPFGPVGGDPTPESMFAGLSPTLPNIQDGVALTLGTVFRPTVNGAVTAAWWHFPATLPSELVRARLYRVSDRAVLDTVTFPAGAAGVRNRVAFTAPIPVTAATNYMIAVWTRDRYVASTRLTDPPSPLPRTVGNLEALAGYFELSPGGDFVYPVSAYENGCYFVDVEFIAA